MSADLHARWLVISPAIARWFTQRNLPVPVRIPVRWHGPSYKGCSCVALSAAPARALGLPTIFIDVADTQLRPVYNMSLFVQAKMNFRKAHI